MDLSDTLVTTRKITATMSPDEIKTAAIATVRRQAGVTPHVETAAEATIGNDGSVVVVIVATVPDVPKTPDPEPKAPDALLPPALVPPLAL